MKSVAFATVVGAAAAVGPVISPGLEIQPFSLQAISTNPKYNLLMANEEHSTASGATPIIMVHKGTADNKRLAGMSILNGQIQVSSPMRKGGSEMDFWSLGDMDDNTGMYAARIQPAGQVKGSFYLRDTTVPQQSTTSSQQPPTLTPFSSTASPTTMQTVTTYTTVTDVVDSRKKREPAADRASHNANPSLPRFLGYRDEQGREAQFYVCHGDEPSKPLPTGTAVGTAGTTATHHPHFPTDGTHTHTRTRVHHSSRTGSVGPTGTGSIAFPTVSSTPAKHQPELMLGFGTKEVPRDCAPIILQAV